MPVDSWIIILLGFSFAFYGTVTVALMFGLGKIKSHGNTGTPFVSVIVAARNEEATIGQLLDSLGRQSYSPYEIIVVDDHSTDATTSVVQKHGSRLQNLRMVSSDRSISEKARKKAALTTGILASKGEVLCFTDADCIPGPEWISELVKQFTEKTGLVAGYSPYDLTPLSPNIKHGRLSALFYRFIRYEETKAAIWSAGSIGLGLAWLCTGRNLAYRRKVWDEVSGYSRIMDSISGDDDLFVQMVRRHTRWRISYTFDPRSFVRTAPPASFRIFIEQRKRHFSAGRFFSLPMKTFFVLFHGSNLLLVLGLFSGLFFPHLLIPSLSVFIGKIVADFCLIEGGESMFSIKNPGLQIVPLELLCLAYNTLVGPLGFISQFQWKPDLKS